MPRTIQPDPLGWAVASVPLARAVSQRRRDVALEMSYADEAPSTRPITVVLADDHAVVRSGLRMLLDSDPQFEVVAEAGDVESARRYVRGHRPAVLVLDLNMPGESSLEAIPTLRKESPQAIPRRAVSMAKNSARARLVQNSPWSRSKNLKLTRGPPGRAK